MNTEGIRILMFGRPTLVVLAGCFLSLAWLLPNHEAPWDSFYVELAAAMGATCVVLPVSIYNWHDVIDLPVGAAILLLVAVIPWVQLIAGPIAFHGDAAVASAYILAVAVMFCAGFSSFAEDGPHIARTLAHAMLWSGIASVGIALYQWFGLDGLSIWAREGIPAARAGGNLAQPNHLATLLMFGLASAAWLQSTQKISTGVAALAGAFLLLGISLTGSRQPLLGLLLLAAWFTRADTIHRATSGQRWLVLGLLLWASLSVWAVQHLPTPLLLADVSTGQDRLQPGLRPLMWSQFARAIQQSPWFGYGWQGGQTAQASAALHQPGLESSAYAHDLFLDLLVWNGVPLGGLLIVLLLAWYARLGLFVRRHGGWFQFATLTFLLAHSLLEYPHAYLYFLVPVALLAGQLEARRAGMTFRAVRWLVPTLGGLLLMVVVAVAAGYLPLAEDRRMVMFWNAGMRGSRDLPAPPDGWFLDQLTASARWARVVPKPGMSSKQIHEQSVVVWRFPSLFLLNQEILILALNDRPEASLVELHRLRGLHGEVPYEATVAQLKALALDTKRPQLLALVHSIDATAPDLPPLPEFSKAMSGQH